MNLDLKKISEIVFLHFGVNPISILPINIGVMTHKFEFAIDNQIYIIRIYPEERKYIAKKEFNIVNLAYKNNCSVPEVCFSNEYKDMTYLIYKKIPGVNLSQCFHTLTNEEKEILFNEIATNYHKLSTIPFTHFGDIMKNETLGISWKIFVKNTISENIKYLYNNKVFEGLTEENIYRKFHKIFDKKIYNSSLVWVDFSQENIIVNNKVLSGFIDFESCMAGDPIMGLGYLFAREGNSEFYLKIKKHFLKLFHFDNEIISFYSFIRILRILKYSNQCLPNGQIREEITDYFKGATDTIKYINS